MVCQSSLLLESCQEGALYMKKILALLFFSALLVGCYQSSTVEETFEGSDQSNESTMNASPTSNRIEAFNVQDVSDVDVTVEDDDDGIVMTFYVRHIERYPTFESMLASEVGEFRYLMLEEINDYSLVSNLYTFTDVHTIESIDVVFYKNAFDFVVGEKYMIHVFPAVEHDFYFISDSHHGIFQLKGDRVSCSQKFEGMYNKYVEDEDAFLALFNNDE